MANGLVYQSLVQRPRNTETILPLWPTAIFILHEKRFNMAVGQQNDSEADARRDVLSSLLRLGIVANDEPKFHSYCVTNSLVTVI